MKLKLISILLLGMTGSMPVFAQTAAPSGLFTGDTKLACEAVLCLSSNAARPHECSASITKFFSIQFTRPDKTIFERKNFLHLCPSASSDVDLLVDGIDACSANALNNLTYNIGGNESTQMVVSNTLPILCAKFYASPYTNAYRPKPLYVGTPENGGAWVDPKDYALAVKNYNQTMAEKATAIQNGNFNGGF